jgi:hypothetical protein
MGFYIRLEQGGSKLKLTLCNFT